MSQSQLSATAVPTRAQQDARVDGVADEAVGTTGHELRLILLHHRHAPVASDVHASPDREPQPENEEEDPEGSAPRIGVQVVAAEGPQAEQDDGDNDDRRPDAQLA